MTINHVSNADSHLASNCSDPQLKRFAMRLKEFLPPVDATPFGNTRILSANEPQIPYGPPPVWQINARATGSATVERPRAYSWERRAVQSGRRHQQLRDTLGEAKVLPTIVLFSTFIAIALGLSLVH